MNSEYLIVHHSLLPEFCHKIVEINQKLHSGEFENISAATKATGISRSTYYKYKDRIFTPAKGQTERKAALSLNVRHQPGNLSRVLNLLGEHQISVLTISQSLPIAEVAAVLMTVDVSSADAPLETVLADLAQQPGVHQPQLLSVE
ncbi:hypothetical protein BK816_00680 [Boudabousia tangfeifanii]|uniref:ACT domain-containing protein n=1 Tax=Boudabousia tangfeifanii TaxID=1912795 RepID=A0A1D9MI43_9ACTO|nr:ACT domain-containing protein [Boudabousia tangfeifanii]AOZ71991.1 hypothetical protein BK816_00680 [Boudabousia tangfeifanii]